MVSQHHILGFEDGGAVEFARQMKVLREETGFQTRLLQVEGRFPQGGPEVITLFVETEGMHITTDELREKITSYVPLPKPKNQGKKKEQADV